MPILREAFGYLTRAACYVAPLAGLTGGVLLLAGRESQGGPWVVLALIAMALAFFRHPKLRSFSFTAWVLVVAGTALFYPGLFGTWGGFDLTLLIVPLTQIIMFGMGSTLNLRDFARVALFPWPVLIGVFLQFGVMPIVGLSLVLAFGFEGELAAGIILIGVCSGGVASNLMTYLAGGRVALSVTTTCVSTFLAPVMTPFLMARFAGRFIEIDVLQMMVSILNVILVPVVAGLVANAILYSPERWARNTRALLSILGASFAVAAVTLWIPETGWGAFLPLKTGAALGAFLIGMVALLKWVVNVRFSGPDNWMGRALPLVSMTAICCILAIITAQTREVLLAVGLLLVVALMIHNAVGYLLGYWGAKGLGYILGYGGYMLKVYPSVRNRMDEKACRTVAFEVGMQNGGMATGLAIDVLQSHVAALPPNVFGTWMNVSGSILANWWKRKPIPQPSSFMTSAARRREAISDSGSGE